MSDRHIPTTDRLLKIVDQMQDQEILVLADLVADRFLTGTPKRISREAPVLILELLEEKLVPGGGANAAANVAALGGRPLTLGCVGNDANGHALLEELQARGVVTDHVLKVDGYQTPTKTRILGGSRHALKQQIVRFDVEDELALDPELRQSFESMLRDCAHTQGVALVSDYGYGAAEPAWSPMLRKAMGPRGLILADSRHRLQAFTGLSGATPNLEEAERLLGRSLGDDAGSVLPGGRALLDSLAADFLLITRGSAGMSLFQGASAIHVPVHGTDQVADVTGAGDTVIGTFSLALAAGADPIEATLLSNYAGGIVVLKMGTATVSAEELGEAVRTDPKPIQELQWAEL